jgi:hypothetical protein
MTNTAAAAQTLTIMAFYSPDNGQVSAYEIQTLTEDRAAAEAIVALFPKSAGLVASTCREYLPAGTKTWGYIMGRAALAKDGVNGGKNETGIKRYRSLAKAADKLGYTLDFATRGSKIVGGYTSREEFEAAL